LVTLRSSVILGKIAGPPPERRAEGQATALVLLGPCPLAGSLRVRAG
jgi:hypothetical protein